MVGSYCGEGTASESLFFQVSLAEIISHSSMTQGCFPYRPDVRENYTEHYLLSFSRIAAGVEVPQTKDVNFFFKNRN